VTTPTPANAVRQPPSVTSAASGSVETSAPSTPTVAVSAARKPNCAGGNQAAAIFSVPTKVGAAPAPTSRRPAKSNGRLDAVAMMRAPTPMTTPPIVMTRRTP